MVCRAERSVVHFNLAHWKVGCRILGPGGYLLHSAEFARLLRHLCEGLLCNTELCGGGLYSRLYGCDRGWRRCSGVRHRIHLCSIHRADGLVQPAGHLWVRGESDMDAVDRLDYRIWHGLGFWRRNLGSLLLCSRSILGGLVLSSLRRLCARPIRRRRGLGTRRMGGDHGQCVSALGIDNGRLTFVRWIQRVDGKRLEQPDRQIV